MRRHTSIDFKKNATTATIREPHFQITSWQGQMITPRPIFRWPRERISIRSGYGPRVRQEFSRGPHILRPSSQKVAINTAPSA
jgi:hypothetical protein